ncbi:MAG: hypothetical protein Q8N30_03340 [Methylococcales bacterium]|jgi:hypothetical protein|nr:hypothetical protein [Methylococcales bacterium]
MIFSLRSFLVFFLVLLQCIAPLVHAHTSEKFLSQGLHIPGLEVYGHSDSVDALESTPSAPVLSCKMSAFCSDMDGQVVGLDAGFSRDFALPIQHLYKIIADLHHDGGLAILPPAVFHPLLATFTTALHISSVPLVSQLTYFAHPARAPPAHV